MESAREARRRKILERGSDRIAFITGQSRNLPDFSPPANNLDENLQTSDAPFSKSSSGLPLSNHPRYEETLKSTTNSQLESDGSEKSEVAQNDGIVASEKDDATLTSRLKNEAEIPTQKVFQGSEQVSTSKDHRSLNEYVNPIISAISEEEKESTTALTAHQPSDQVESAISTKRDAQNLFSAKRINNALSTSENIRILCAVIIALLVVLTNLGFLGAFASITISRPIFLVLLTDLTIILGLLMGTQEIAAKDKEITSNTNNAYDLASNLSKTLEAVVVFQKVISAIFIDCSICAVIMICGFAV